MFVVFDIETTGFSEITCDVIQFAYALFDKNNCFVKSECLYFYYDGMHWSEEAFKVHGIPLEFLKQHKDKFKENVIKMYTVLRNNNVVGHNAKGFDCPFCRTWLTRMGMDPISYGIINDTMQAFKPVTKKARCKLTKLSEVRNISDDNIKMMMDFWFPSAGSKHAHDAAYDVTLTALLTLDALRNNYMTFTPLNSEQLNITDDRFLGTVASDPDLYFNAASSTRSLCFAAYEDKADISEEADLNELKNNGRYLPCEFHELEYGVWEGSHNGITFTVTTNIDGDRLTIKTPEVEVTFDSYTPAVTKLLKDTFGEG